MKSLLILSLFLCFNAYAKTVKKKSTLPVVPKVEKVVDAPAVAPTPPTDTKSAGNPIVVLDTTAGTIEIELLASKAPISVANFLKYVDQGHYQGTIFHRVINGFMVQGGGMNKNMEEKKVGSSIKNEATNGLLNETGTVAMARMSDPDSATAQFFINVENNSFLDHKDKGQGFGYAVFGKVKSGMSVVNKIKMVKTGTTKGYTDVPVEPIEIKSAKRK